MRNTIHKGDAAFDTSKLSPTVKLLLLPVFIKAFGIFKATILLYGK